MGAVDLTLDADRLRAELAVTRFADLRWKAETGSTNADLLELAAAGDAEGVVLGADHQTAGRGRRGRRWLAPPGRSLLVSVLLRPPASAVDLVMPATALAAVDAVREVTGADVEIKWPNDLVWRGADGGQPDRKLAGLLAEAMWPPGADAASGWRPPAERERVAVVVGMGLNVSSEARPSELDGIAVACDELIHPLDTRTVAARQPLLLAWLRSLDGWYTQALDPDERHVVMATCRDRSATLGRRVRVDLGSEEVDGVAVDLTEQGQLVVRTDTGEERTLAVGDVTHLRTA